MPQGMRKIPIVGKKQEPLTILIKTSYGKEAVDVEKRDGEHLVYCSIMRVGHGTDIPLGFVKNHVEMLLEKKGFSPKGYGLPG
jgi:hypothetical protein